MKGLLIKDFYIARKHCKIFFIAAAALFVCYCCDLKFANDLYPCMVLCLVPIILMAYDKKSKWSEYCGVLPYNEIQIVSEKYLAGLILIVSTVLISGAAEAIKTSIDGTFDLYYFLADMAFLFQFFAMAEAILLFFAFAFGTEKVLVISYMLTGAYVLLMSYISTYYFIDLSAALVFEPDINISPFISSATAAFFYAVSWILSTVSFSLRKIIRHHISQIFSTLLNEVKK